MPVGILPTDLTYTSVILDEHLNNIAQGLSAAGFRNFRVAMAADNAAVHRRALTLVSSPRVHPNHRESGGMGVELTEGEDAILTLAAFRYRGESCETVTLTDPAHAWKNGTLQLLSMARLLRVFIPNI